MSHLPAAMCHLALAALIAGCQQEGATPSPPTAAQAPPGQGEATPVPDPARAEGARAAEPEAERDGPCASADGCLAAGSAAARAGSAADAARLYGHGCELGSGQSCARLGAMVRDGRGVPADDRRAEELFHRACDQGSQAGCDALGH